MRALIPVRIGEAVVDVAVPRRPGLALPGVRMAGFRGGADSVLDLRMVPYPELTLFVDFGDALFVDDACGRQQRGCVVVGLAPDSVHGYARDADCLQIRLSPAVAHAVLGASSELGGTVVDLEDLWGRDAVRFREQLRDAGSWDERFAIAEGTLGRRCEAGRTLDPEVAFIWQRMMGSGGQARVSRLAEEVGWSRKRLWSRFRAQVGLTPKHAAKLIRFDHAAHRLAAGDSAASVAADGGFVDQSHLSRDVKAFTGLTPATVAHALWLAVDDVAWPVPGQCPGQCQCQCPGPGRRLGRSGTFVQDVRRCGDDAEGHAEN